MTDGRTSGHKDRTTDTWVRIKPKLPFLSFSSSYLFTLFLMREIDNLSLCLYLSKFLQNTIFQIFILNKRNKKNCLTKTNGCEKVKVLCSIFTCETQKIMRSPHPFLKVEHLLVEHRVISNTTWYSHESEARGQVSFLQFTKNIVQKCSKFHFHFV